MASFATLVDNFADLTNWPDSYEAAAFSATGGRGRIASNTAYNGLYTANTWSLPDGAPLRFRAYPNTTPGSTTASTAFRITKSVGDGADVGLFYDANDGNLYFESRTDYWDDNRTSVTYSGTTHAYWGLRRSGSNLIFETAPSASEGVPGTWTTRRTITLPAYLTSATDLRALYETNRDGAASGQFSEIDYLNTPPPETVNKGAFFLLF